MIDVMFDIDAGSRWDPSGLEGACITGCWNVSLKDIIQMGK